MTITVTPHATIYEGESTRLFQLLTLYHALKLEKTGMRLSRGRSALKVSKTITGLSSNNRDVHIARLKSMIEEKQAQTTIKAEDA